VRLAIVGTGISGLACAHALHRDHEIEVFEAEGWVGGHAHTVPVELGGRRFDVDTGFVVWNERTYPGFARLLHGLGVASRDTEMSFSVSCERTGLEYGGGSLGALLADPRSLLRPAFLRMVRDVPRFYREARRFLRSPDPKVTLGAWLAGRGFGADLAALHVLPMTAAIWSADPREVEAFPAATVLGFFAQHGLLALRDRPRWRTIAGGSQRYVDALSAPFRDRIRLRCPVREVRRRTGGVDVLTDGGERRFDAIVLAAHADDALAVLADPTPAERVVLGAIRFAENDVVLHTDARLLPRRPRARASWNYHLGAERAACATVTYDMARLQGLDAPEPLLVTLNGADRIDPARVLARFAYRHPVLDRTALLAQSHWREISGVRGTHFCGAYWRFGFHEDGVQSALRVARALGAALP
jgi:predicted NAD/FAD-binding protein